MAAYDSERDQLLVNIALSLARLAILMQFSSIHNNVKYTLKTKMAFDVYINVTMTIYTNSKLSYSVSVYVTLC